VTDTYVQLAAFGGPMARRTDPETSVLAAQTVDANGQSAEVLLFLRLKPRTAADLAERMRLADRPWAFPGLVASRLSRLEKQGLVERDGTAVSETSGHEGTLWKAVSDA
jgi:hypothetical protein